MGFSARRYHAVMLALIALTVIASFQTVGTLLVFGMLVAPASAGALLARRISTMMIWAALIGAASVYLGLLASYHFNTAAGATVVLTATLCFFLVFIVQSVRAHAIRSPLWQGGSHERHHSEAMPGESSSGGRPPGQEDGVIIATRDLAVGYAGESIVSGINVTVRASESLALVGINGSGKSTLLKTLVGLLPPVGGSFVLFGQVAGTVPRRIAYLGQTRVAGFLLPLEAADVALMGCYPRRRLFGRITTEDRALVRASLEVVGMGSFARTPLRALSGGQQQRVFLAQVLVQQADLLVLDEPTAGLDAGGREVYLRAIQGELERGAALVAATHDVQEAAASTQALLLARRVVALGPARTVLTAETLLETFGVPISLADPIVARQG